MRKQLFVLSCFLVTLHSSLTTEAAELRVVYLQGTPYEMGRQHGEQLREEVRASVRQLLSYIRGYLKVPLLSRLAGNAWLDYSWNLSAPHLPKDYAEELRGLSHASGLPLRDLYRMHAVPDRTYSCAGLAAWGRATTDGRLIHTRNLDWNIDIGVQRYAVLFVVRPEGKQSYVSAGWAGFIGVLTGVNEQQVSIGQIGAETTDTTWKGLPMPFLMRRVMEEARTVDDAVSIIRDAPRTVGINYVVADAKAPRAVAIETTRRRFAVFEADDAKEHAVPYARPMKDAVFRGDTAVDAGIRSCQIASGGNPKAPGLEPPTGSAYVTRYVGQGERLQAVYGRLDAAKAREIAQAVAPSSNIQSVVIVWPEMWVANAEGRTRAAQSRYDRFNLVELLTRR